MQFSTELFFTEKETLEEPMVVLNLCLDYGLVKNKKCYLILLNSAFYA